MKTREGFAAVALATIVQAGLLVVPSTASAQEDSGHEEGEGEVKALICPTNYVEVGAQNVPTSSPKFGEYSGLNHSGVYGLAEFSVRGGSAWCQKGGTLKWEAEGSDLATTSRSLSARISDQGHWNFGVGFDQLRHYTTNGTFETPLQGSSGDNQFSLPPNFGVINTTVAAGTRALTPSQLAAYHTEDIYVQRNDTSFVAGYAFNRQWSLKFNYNHLDQSGSKLMSTGTDAYDLSSSGGFNYNGQRILTLMNPNEYANDSFNLALNWVGAKAYVNVASYVSLLHDDNRGASFPNPFVSGGSATNPNPAPGTVPLGGFPLDTISTPPSSQFYQMNLTGGYIFSSKTKLVGSLSYGINTQDESYAGAYTAVPNTAPGLPVSSLNGRVVTTHFDAKLTHQVSASINLSAGVKYNERANETSSHTYTFLDIGGSTNTAVNIPMSNRREQFDAAADWRIASNQRLHIGYEYDNIHRWCKNDLANQAQGVLSSTNAGYYVDASCVQVRNNSENRIVTTYKLKFADTVEFGAGYTYGDRQADVNQSFYNPIQANSSGFENYGYIAYFDAARRQNLFKANVNWQPTEKFNVDVSGRYTKDDYYDSSLGVQNGDSTTFNVDANYTLTEKTAYGAYGSWQKRTRDLLTANGRSAVPPVLTTLWGNTLEDRDNSIGLYGQQKGLLGGRLQLKEDLNYNLGKTKYNTTLVQGIAAAVGNSGAPPTIQSELSQFNVTATYMLSHSSHLMFGYLYQRLKSNDYYYNAYQYGYTPATLLPSNLKAPNYSVNSVYVAYRYLFQ